MVQRRKVRGHVLWPNESDHDTGAHDSLAAAILEEFTLDTPGMRQAVFEIAKMRRYGVDVTMDIVRKCVADCAEMEARNAEADRVAAKRAGNHEPVVYYIRHGNLVKIGTTVNLTNRVSSLSLRPDHVIATEPGSTDTERLRHQQFAHLRSHGEWFTFADDLQAHIAAITERAA